MAELKNEELTVFRRRNIGFVFQNYNLLPILNVSENITLPLKLDGLGTGFEFLRPDCGQFKIAGEIVQYAKYFIRRAAERVAIARALSMKPAVILADEPTGNLDSKTGIEVVGLLKASAAKFNQTIVVVTHNEEIAQMADRMIRIEDGKVR